MTGFLLSAPHLDADHAKRALAGNICRCTGYEAIVDAIETTMKNRAAGKALGKEAA